MDAAVVVDVRVRRDVEARVDHRHEQVDVPFVGHAVGPGEREHVRLQGELVEKHVGRVVFEGRSALAVLRWMSAAIVVLKPSKAQMIEIPAIQLVEVDEDVREADVELAATERRGSLHEHGSERRLQ